MKLEELIKKNKEKFTQTDLAIADFLMDNKNDELDLSINELAKKCLTSRTSILRFTQKIGFGGYSEFKYFLKQKDHTKKDQTKEDDKKLNQILESLDKSNNIFIYGNGDFEDIIKKIYKILFKRLRKAIRNLSRKG
ncbi:putative transcriptional regulator GlvR [Anaerococcus hydrogenalis DSM 7454]|uniref:Putative transcriptional regulator GlvR n=1 Tax=Anaerococcus hydrogenalis DSM 7454 TaxID=561177 RepID=B6W753_9FIRM|nr:MurR/RpiR family transcriptional regulator [Anaerococcus hydrogenalis]EEB36727.1 putative transcriptional regulator GlvR [Anaerococcus hydrogenalis DSM 7454]